MTSSTSSTTLLVDPRRGSTRHSDRGFVGAIEAGLMTPFGISADLSHQLAGDFEFIGWTPLGPTPIGGEHKSCDTGDAFTSMFDGRLTGTQIPRMVQAYPWVRYVVIEGLTRRSHKDGVLELRVRGDWQQAFTRRGAGISYDEWRGRIESIEEFWSEPHVAGHTRVIETPDQQTTAAWIAWAMGKYWAKPYEQHGSARQWDRSREVGGRIEVEDVLLGTTSELPLTELWAERLDGIGRSKATFIGRHFGSAYDLAHATADEWQAVEFKEKVAKGPRAGQLQTKRLSAERAKAIVEQIRRTTK